jgi:metacaspase-1
MSSLQQLQTQFNANVNSLNAYYNNLIASINRQNISNRIKQTYIANYVNLRNAAYAKLVSDYNAAVAALKATTATTPKKSALLVGINYIGSPYELSGCINDTNNIKDLLVNKYGYKNIVMLNDTTSEKPTRSNILSELTKLLQNSVSGDTLFFQYSGHGTNTPDLNGDELDGQDEMICPVDLKFIVDDELNALLKKYLKTGVTLYCMFDSCFSGTILDLRYNYLDSSNLDKLTVNLKEPDLSSSKIICISGCMDSQTSADAAIIDANNKVTYSGAMTYSFLSTMETNKYSISYKDLITQMRSLLNDNGYTQKPQLSCSTNVDISQEKVNF